MRKKLICACYIIITLVAIILFFSGIYSKDDVIKAFLLNISAACVGTVFFFLIFKFFRADSDTILLEKFDDIISNKLIEQEYTVKEMDALKLFFNSINNQKVSEMCLIGYSMAHIFQSFETELIEILKKGTKISILLINPDSTAGRLMVEAIGDETQVNEPHLRSIRYISNIHNKLSEKKRTKLLMRKVSWIPSCSILYAKQKNTFYSICIGINGYVLDKELDRRLYSVSISKYQDKRMIFLETHFNKLWDKGIEVPINK